MIEAVINPPASLDYLGTELEVFREANRWKRYFASHLRRYLTGHVLEVGAGIGGTSRALCGGNQQSWTMLEPDARLAAQLREELARNPLPVPFELHVGTTRDLPSQTFDCVLYIDVIEHIESDREELERAASLLAPGGSLLILVPAHQWLFTPFDQAIGHFRRYSRRSLQDAVPARLNRRKLIYLDSVGLLASLANKLWLNSAAPTLRQIQFWDRILVPASRWMDPLLLNSLGKSVLGVWQRPE